ncbi:MAG: outer membrane beta-barrel protein [Stellaceae bacterium]
MVAGIGAIAAFSAQAQELIGDPVDQILKAQTLSSADTPPPAAAPAAQQPQPQTAPISLTSAPQPQPTATPVAQQSTPAISIAPLPPPRPAAAVAPPPAAATPVAATLSSSDLAEPPPPPAAASPTERWSGFYVGLNFGAGNTTGGSGEACNNTETGTSSGCDIIANGALSTSGILGGGQFGYLRRLALGWQMPLVVGGEVDFDGSGISGSQNVSGPFSLVGLTETCSPCNFSARQSLNSLTTIRARVGVPLDDRFLLYATGGVALGGVKVSQDLAFLGSSEGDVVTKKDTLVGPVFGAGLEFALRGPWSARIEGLYYDLGKLNTTAVPVNGAPSNFNDFKTFEFRGGIIRLAVNLRLGDLPY